MPLNDIYEKLLLWGENMDIKQITNKISYIEASENPLSADIGIIKSENGIWLYDVGNNENSIMPLKDKYNIVLSHFHLDHVGNLDKLDIENLYVSRFTFDHIGRGIIVEKDIYIDDLHIFPLPTSHAKGSLGLEVNEEYAFIGDAMYSKTNAEYYIYNAQLLKQEIEVLKKLKAKYLLVSHRRGIVMDKDEAIRNLEEIYSKRDIKSSEIYVKKA